MYLDCDTLYSGGPTLWRNQQLRLINWLNIRPLPQPISASDAVYFHGVVLIAGGQCEGDKILTTTYVLRPPRINGTEEGEPKDLGQWTKLSNELPNPVWPNCICRVDEEVFLFGEPACLS